MQSPINLTPKIARIVHNSTEILQTNYKPVEAILKNRGFDMKVIIRAKKTKHILFYQLVRMTDMLRIRLNGKTTQGRS